MICQIQIETVLVEEGQLNLRSVRGGGVKFNSVISDTDDLSPLLSIHSFKTYIFFKNKDFLSFDNLMICGVEFLLGYLCDTFSKAVSKPTLNIRSFHIAIFC